MGLIWSLKRLEEVNVPSWPDALTKTVTPPEAVASLIPAMKVLV
jgi:hypothetical protein